MNRIASAALAAVAALAGCKHAASQPLPYEADIGRICDVMHLSGAETATAAQRPLMTAKWLGDNVQTMEAHQFLVKIQPLDGADKAAALDAEAKRIGLESCALSAQWRQ